VISWNLLFAFIPGIILFLYGIEQFSREIQIASGEYFRDLIQRLTRTPARGTIAGALVTAVVQSSTATTVITIGLVNAGIISFTASLGIIIGSNIGTTITTQLIALNLTAFAPALILAGFLIGIVGGRYKVFGRPIFYFGLVFFSLSMISAVMEPYRADPQLIGFFSLLTNVFLQIGFGFLITSIFQSSSVTSGLVVVMAQSGLITPGVAIPILMGANLGTPTTSLLVAWRMNTAAKRAAVAHFLFNFLGVLLFLPLLGPFTGLIEHLGGGAAQQVANAHLLFNLTCGVVFLALIRPFASLVQRMVPGREDDIVFVPHVLSDPLPEDTPSGIVMVGQEIIHLLGTSREMVHELTTLIERPDAPSGRLRQLQEYAHYLDDRIADAVIELSQRDLDQIDAARLAGLIRISSLGRVLADEAGELVGIVLRTREKGISLPAESQAMLTGMLRSCGDNLKLLAESFPGVPDMVDAAMRSMDETLREDITGYYRHYIIRMATAKTPTAGTIPRMLFSIEGMAATIREMRKSARLLGRG